MADLPCLIEPVERKGQHPVTGLWGECGQVHRLRNDRAPDTAFEKARRGCGQPCGEELDGQLLVDDFDRDRELDVAVQLGGHRVGAE